MRRTTHLLLTIVAAAGCGSPPPSPPPVPAGWQTITAQGFTFQAPPDLRVVPIQGIDSFVGKYDSPTLEMGYDLGWYSNALDGEGYTGRRVTVDGKAARLATKDDVIAIHFPKVAGKTKLTMDIRLKGADPKVAEAILHSIDFR